MRRGARDYIEKPWDDERLLVDRADADRSAPGAAAQPAAAGGERPAAARRDAGVHRRVARRCSEVRQTIERVAPSDAAVLITGEHGTGKEVVAAWLHALSRSRERRPLVTMNAGGLAEGVAESELFGHVKGAFTDARVRPHRLLRAGRRGHAVPRRDRQHADAAAGQAAARAADRRGAARRLVARCATSTCACCRRPTPISHAEIAAGRFREDLLYRLNTVVIHLPPLRERREDIEPLARPLPRALRGAVPQAARRLRRRRRGGAAGASLARQRARAGAQRSSARC